jgi:hypothetical protein
MILFAALLIIPAGKDRRKEALEGAELRPVPPLLMRRINNTWAVGTDLILH